MVTQKKKNKKLKWLVGLAICLVIFGVGFGFYKKRQSSALAATLDARKVRIEKMDIRKELSLTGKVRPASSVAVYSPVSGQLKDLTVQEGNVVKEGQILFSVLQDSSGQQELETRQAEAQTALLNLKSAEDNANRRRGVKDLFSASENEKAETDLQRVKLIYEEARRKLSLLEDSLGLKGSNSKSTAKNSPNRNSLIYMKAPKAGIITFISKSVGESVFGTTMDTDASGREVLTISDQAQMIVRSRILEADLALVKPDMQVEVRLDAFRNKVYRGKISRISQQGIEDKTGGYTYFETDVLIDKPDSDVRSKMNASMLIVVAEKKDVLGLPASAVATINGNSVVEAVSNKSTPVYKKIKIGLVTEKNVEIVDSESKVGDEFLTIDFSKIDTTALAQGKLGSDESAKKEVN